jgi:hypothetical protein
MGYVLEIWHWTQRIAGVLLVVCLCLYLVRCAVAWDFITFNKFDYFMRGLVSYIFT